MYFSKFLEISQLRSGSIASLRLLWPLIGKCHRLQITYMCLYDSRIISDRITGFLPQVTCEGQVIGAIVAETQTEAQRAAKAVKVQYEELEPIITIEVTYALMYIVSTYFKYYL